MTVYAHYQIYCFVTMFYKLNFFSFIKMFWGVFIKIIAKVHLSFNSTCDFYLSILSEYSKKSLFQPQNSSFAHVIGVWPYEKFDRSLDEHSGAVVRIIKFLRSFCYWIELFGAQITTDAILVASRLLLLFAKNVAKFNTVLTLISARALVENNFKIWMGAYSRRGRLLGDA